MIALTPMLLFTLAAAAFAWRMKRERLLTFWLLWSGLIHIVMESSYGLLPHVVTARATTTFTQYLFTPAPIASWFDPRWWASVYGQYARYDGRYTVADPTILFICYTELLLGPLCFLLVWMIQSGNRLRHRVQLVLCTAQFYGTVLYFVAPMIQGNWSTVMTHDTFELIVFVISLNGLWMVIPGWMIYQSFTAPTASAPAVASRQIAA